MNTAIIFGFFGVFVMSIMIIDFLDHRKYSDGDGLVNYVQFVLHIAVRGVIPSSLVFIFILAGVWNTKSSLFVVISAGSMFLLYMNTYNVMSFPDRLIMILSKELEGITKNPPYRFICIHPFFFWSYNAEYYYYYCMNSKQSIIVPFTDSELTRFVTEFIKAKSGSCSCCRAENVPVRRVNGVTKGYIDYSIMYTDLGTYKVGSASKRPVEMCESCWSDCRQKLLNSEAIDSSELLSQTI